MFNPFSKENVFDALNRFLNHRVIDENTYQQRLVDFLSNQPSFSNTFTTFMIQKQQHAYTHDGYGIADMHEHSFTLFKAPTLYGQWTMKQFTKNDFSLLSESPHPFVVVDFMLFYLAQHTQSEFIQWLRWASTIDNLNLHIQYFLTHQHDLNMLTHEIQVLCEIPIGRCSNHLETELYLS